MTRNVRMIKGNRSWNFDEKGEKFLIPWLFIKRCTTALAWCYVGGDLPEKLAIDLLQSITDLLYNVYRNCLRTRIEINPSLPPFILVISDAFKRGAQKLSLLNLSKRYDIISVTSQNSASITSPWHFFQCMNESFKTIF